jgi:hypothetical protein
MQLTAVDPPCCRVNASPRVLDLVADAAEARARDLREFGTDGPLADRYEDVANQIHTKEQSETVNWYASDLSLAASAMNWYSFQAFGTGDPAACFHRRKLANELSRLEYEYGRQA